VSGAAAALAAAVLDLLYPPRCAACGEGLGSSAEEPFCEVCR
jgi:Double zinc ribbon domain